MVVYNPNTKKMNKILLIIHREYLLRVRKKSFVIMTLLTPLLFAALMVVPAWLVNSDALKEVKNIEVFDETGIFKDKMRSTKQLTFTYVDGQKSQLEADFNKSNAFALLHIPATNFEEKGKISLKGKKTISTEVEMDIRADLERILKDYKLLKVGITQEMIDKSKTRLSMNTTTLKDGKETETSSIAVLAIGFISGFMIYISVFIYGAQVMRSVIEEKSSRVIEVMISAVKPIQLMLGKIIGVACVGLTQFLLWIVFTAIISSVTGRFLVSDQLKNQLEKSKQVQMNEKTQQIATEANDALDEKKGGGMMEKVTKALSTINYVLVIGCFLFYFLFGYLLYSAMFAAVGSAGDSETDAQQFMLPVSMPLILGIIMAQSVAANPDSSLAFWGSMIPFTSPVVMMVRVPYGIPAWEIALSMTILLGTFLGMTWLAARIYRVGILRYGQKVNFKEIGKWIFMK